MNCAAKISARRRRIPCRRAKAARKAIGRLAVAWPIKYAGLCAVALTLLFLSYHYLARGTFIGTQLNGRRYPRIWPWQTAQG